MVEEVLRFNGDPVEAIDGLLVDVKIGPLKLQHEVRKLLALRVAGNISS